MDKGRTKISVTFGNELNRARTFLDVVEQRIILNALAQVPDHAPITQEQLFYVSACDLVELGSSPAMVYRDMKAAVKTLFHRYVTLTEEDAEHRQWVRMFRYVDEIRYCDDSGRVVLRFSYPILPFIQQLRQEFTQFGLLETKGLRSSYAVRLYGILAQFRATGKCTIKVTDLRERLDLGDRFKLYGHLKQKVLKLAIKQINEGERTAFTVSMREKKISRRVDALTFTLSSKEPQQPEQTQEFCEKHTVDIFSGLSEAQCSMTGAQINMFADWLSLDTPQHVQRRATYLGKTLATSSQVFKALRRLKLEPDGSSASAFNDWLKRKLRDPLFVKAIAGDLLMPLGWKPVNV